MSPYHSNIVQDSKLSIAEIFKDCLFFFKLYNGLSSYDEYHGPGNGVE